MLQVGFVFEMWACYVWQSVSVWKLFPTSSLLFHLMIRAMLEESRKVSLTHFVFILKSDLAVDYWLLNQWWNFLIETVLNKGLLKTLGILLAIRMNLQINQWDNFVIPCCNAALKTVKSFYCSFIPTLVKSRAGKALICLL